MFFHIVSIVMCLYIRIIPSWLFLSYLIYLWFCFQSVILSGKLLRNSKMLSKGSCFFFSDQSLIFWNSFLFFKKILVFTWKSWFFSQTTNSLERCQFQFIQFFLCLLFFETECILYYYIYIIYNIKNILSISK